MPNIKSERKVLRKVTNCRISLPPEMLSSQGIHPGDRVQLCETSKGILITRYSQNCFICGCSKEENLQEIGNLKICTSCIKNIKELEVE